LLNFFDIAEAIDLEKLRILLGPHTGAPLSRFRHSLRIAQASPLEESLELTPFPAAES